MCLAAIKAGIEIPQARHYTNDLLVRRQGGHFLSEGYDYGGRIGHGR